jgi:hypothetical protein
MGTKKKRATESLPIMQIAELDEAASLDFRPQISLNQLHRK